MDALGLTLEDDSVWQTSRVFILERADSRYPNPMWASWQGSANNRDRDNNEEVPPRCWIYAMLQASWPSTYTHISSLSPHSDPGQ